MTLEEEVFGRLMDNSAVAALVGTRVWAIHAPQDSALPRIVFARTETDNLATLGGRGTHDRVQVSCIAYAATVEAARAVATAAHTALNGWRGTGAVQHCRVIGRLQGVEGGVQADGVRRDALLLTILSAEA